MEDKEIINALECCSKMSLYHIPCEDCPAIHENCLSGRILTKQALDLINRQKAEIERLTLEYAGFQAGVKQFAKDGKKVKADVITELAVILKRRIDFYRGCDDLDYNSVLNALEQDIHNLEKELAGENIVSKND